MLHVGYVTECFVLLAFVTSGGSKGWPWWPRPLTPYSTHSLVHYVIRNSCPPPIPFLPHSCTRSTTESDY